MKPSKYEFATGLPGLDDVLQGVRAGDNLVWQVDDVEAYIPFVHHFCREANRRGQDLIYFRFADHVSLLPDDVEARVHELHPENGFETFVFEIHDVLDDVGLGACYVFDCLSDLTVDWYSDRMLGNLFRLTCPYLYELETATYFGLIRNHHTSHAVDAIHTTAQVVVDVYCNQNRVYVHPLKVWERYTDTMYMLHEWREDDAFVPVTKSVTISEIRATVPQPWLDLTVYRSDVWTRTFTEAQELVDRLDPDQPTPPDVERLLQQILRMAITRDERLLSLCSSYFSLQDVVGIGKRMIGTGLIGGKSVGMLLSRAILCRANTKWKERLEAHDSFFVGSDVFYTYLVQNRCWSIRRHLQQNVAPDALHETRQRLRSGTFPQDIRNQFSEMLNYFGQSPIIVRSSSLLEDAYGNAFSGKYDSVFCANQGTPRERLEAFMAAVRTVYVSTLSRGALAYRNYWKLLDRDEQMSILVQRVSGELHGYQFYPQAAGVGFSYNPYVWHQDIDPHAGVLRLVFGLGTRAVDRIDDDYTRVVALNAPEKRPEHDLGEVRKFAQRRVDILDLQANRQVSRRFEDVAGSSPELPVHLFASRDMETEQLARKRGMKDFFPWVLTFDELLKETEFVSDMRGMLKDIESAYEHPVDIEFTANFIDKERYSINLLQCRPFQVKGTTDHVEMPTGTPEEAIVLQSRGPIIGTSSAMELTRIVFVVPKVYGTLPMRDRYAVARLIGRLAHASDKTGEQRIMLIGPGRWGTSTPSLGVPVSFAEIDSVSVLCEVAAMHEGLIPDLSLGTHFLNDLVEMDMLYMAIYPDRADDRLNGAFFDGQHNALAELLPAESQWAHAVKVLDRTLSPGLPALQFHVNCLEQNALLRTM